VRAIFVHEFGGPEVMRLEDVPDRPPGPAEVLVRIHAAGVNPVDAYIRTGTYARKPALPYTPGTDGAGVVEAIGADVKSALKVGDRVYVAGDNQSASGAGTYAERALCAPSMLHPLPEHVTFSQGAALGVPYATAFRSLFIRAQAARGETVLVHGATGGVGIAAVELAHGAGMTVFGTGGTEKGLAAVREHGADHVFNHREANYLDDVMKATDGRGVDLVMEMAAHINLDKDLSVLARNGRVVVIGSRGRIEVDPRATMGRDAAILGLTLFNSSPDELQSIHAAIVDGLRKRTLNPLVGREFPLSDAARAHEAVLEPGSLGKIVILP